VSKKRTNVGDEVTVEQNARRAELRRDLDMANLKVVLGTREGRLFVWSLLERTRVFQTVWDPSSRIHYLAGRQELGQDILHDVMELDPEVFLTMKAEANEEEERINV